jgi:hypothetical protein
MSSHLQYHDLSSFVSSRRRNLQTERQDLQVLQILFKSAHNYGNPVDSFIGADFSLS